MWSGALVDRLNGWLDGRIHGTFEQRFHSNSNPMHLHNHQQFLIFVSDFGRFWPLAGDNPPILGSDWSGQGSRPLHGVIPGCCRSLLLPNSRTCIWRCCRYWGQSSENKLKTYRIDWHIEFNGSYCRLEDTHIIERICCHNPLAPAKADRFRHDGDQLIPGSGLRWSHVHRTKDAQPNAKAGAARQERGCYRVANRTWWMVIMVIVTLVVTVRWFWILAGEETQWGQRFQFCRFFWGSRGRR